MSTLTMVADDVRANEDDERQIDLLLAEIARVTGYDFTNYARNPIRRRLHQQIRDLGLASLADLRAHLLAEGSAAEDVVHKLVVRTTAMFRDPSFFRALRQEVIPHLRTYPFIRIWVAGCSTGEEVFSLAILLREEGLEARTRIYATDVNEIALRSAKLGIFPLSGMQQYTQNYLETGGAGTFSDYYTASFNAVRFDPLLVQRVVFARHNLASDGPFNEFQLILCRNVLIYFNRELQARTLRLFDSSLVRLGFFALGHKESLLFSSIERSYSPVNGREKIFRKQMAQP